MLYGADRLFLSPPHHDCRAFPVGLIVLDSPVEMSQSRCLCCPHRDAHAPIMLVSSVVLASTCRRLAIATVLPFPVDLIVISLSTSQCHAQCTSPSHSAIAAPIALLPSAHHALPHRVDVASLPPHLSHRCPRTYHYHTGAVPPHLSPSSSLTLCTSARPHTDDTNALQ